MEVNTSEEKIGMYTAKEILEFMTDGEGRGFMGRSMFDAMLEGIKDLQQKVEQLESIRKETIEYINNEIFKRTILVGVGTKKYTRNILDNILNILNKGGNNVKD